MQSVPIITKVVSSNPAHGEVYSIQHYVIKFVSDLQQVGGCHESKTKNKKTKKLPMPSEELASLKCIE
jgi:hypothetical protein